MNKVVKNILGIVAGFAVAILIGWLLPFGGIIAWAIAGAIGGVVWALISGDFSKKANETETVETTATPVETVEVTEEVIEVAEETVDTTEENNEEN